MPDPTPLQVLACPIEDGDAPTIGAFFQRALHELWRETEGFSGKRPLGNSGWDWDIYAALVRAKMISGDFDEEGYLDSCDQRAGDRLIHSAIDVLAQNPDPGPDLPEGVCPGTTMSHASQQRFLRYAGHCQSCAANIAKIRSNEGISVPAWAVRALIDRLQFERGRSVVDL